MSMNFAEMLLSQRKLTRRDQHDFAIVLGYSAQYQCDLEKGRRLPSVAYVNKLCESLMFGSAERRKWHQAGAVAHGWEVS